MPKKQNTNNGADGWRSNRTTFHAEQTQDQKLHVSGIYHYFDQDFTFSLNEQTKGDYVMRGRIGLRSPKDGSLLKNVVKIGAVR